MMNNPEFVSQQAQAIFFSQISRDAVWPIQLLVQWVPGVLSLGVKQLGFEIDHFTSSFTSSRVCVNCT
jgi:hypothetical protein